MSLSPIRLLLLGAPGSGKGTQTSRLLRSFPQIHALSSGDILRGEIASASPLGKKAAAYVSSGALVPDDTMAQLVTSQLERRQYLSPACSWLLDGFPRTRGQAAALSPVLRRHNADLNLVVELDVDPAVILRRIEARWVHAASGRVYNLDYNPPARPFVDDITGEPLVKRSDDTAEVFHKRMAVHEKEIAPLRQFYRDQGVFHTVLGDTSDVIYPQLHELVEKTFGQ